MVLAIFVSGRKSQEQAENTVESSPNMERNVTDISGTYTNNRSAELSQVYEVTTKRVIYPDGHFTDTETWNSGGKLTSFHVFEV